MNKLICILCSFVLAISLQAQQRSTYLTEMQELKERFGVSFIYDSSLPLNGSCPEVSTQPSLSRSLRALFDGSDIHYSIRGHSVILRKKAETTRVSSSERYPVFFDTLRPSHIETAWRDTLSPALKTDYSKEVTGIGRMQGSQRMIRNVISPLGEGDPLRWVQRLPGVAVGADGSSALYVRGGNVGNNQVLLDGVPIYGYSHLLGLTTVIPPETIESAVLSRGGFEGSQGNFTSSSLHIRTKTPEAVQTRVAVNNFLVSAMTEGRRARMAYQVSGRISPLALEYKLLRSMLPERLAFERFGALVGDFYGKVRFDIDADNCLDGFLLGSMDRYSFTQVNGAQNALGWNNILGQVRYVHTNGNSRTGVRFYVNRYASAQGESMLYKGGMQELTLKSELTEFSLIVSRERLFNEYLKLSYGMNLRDALFNPGQVGAAPNISNAFLSSLWLQGDYELPEKLSLMATVRGNLYTRFSEGNTFFVPDAGLAVRWSILPNLRLEATFDKTSQFYHTLEGLPVGWSVDMLVPSVSGIGPEKVLQAGIGLNWTIGNHSVQVGYFQKRMDGLVYYQYASNLFNGALAAWEEHVDTGQGFSFGGEFLYEMSIPQGQVQIAYTLSKTWREGFVNVLDGAPFHAKFDRTHILNISASWHGLQLALTWQSGHWENSASKKATMHVLEEEWVAEYFTGVNDFRMPDLFRLDIGYDFSFQTGRCQHEIRVGVCNVTNHFNPFMLYYDLDEESWKEVSLLPILPNFSYKVSF